MQAGGRRQLDALDQAKARIPWLVTALAAITCGFFLIHGSTACAAPLAPDLFSSWISIIYDADTGAFTANGWPESFLKPNLDQLSITGGSFQLSAIITKSGALQSGTLTIDGNLGAGDPMLLSGDLIDLDVLSPLSLEFLVNLTPGSSGVLQPYYGSRAEVILSETTDLTIGDFSKSYDTSDDGDAVADVLDPVPEPPTFVLVLLGAGLIVGLPHCRRC